MFSKNKYLKNTICWLVIIALLLQSFPLEAKAGFLEDMFKKLMQKIRLPDELKLTEKGDVMLGSWQLAKCIYTEKNPFGQKECVNPFSVITLGENQVSLIKEDGSPALPRPKIPEDCELTIPLPSEEEVLTKEERRALSKACSDFRRIQRAAANVAYFSKKLFNNTDPLSDCLFLRNCKTACYLRFGEISYIISWVDILIAIGVPAGWINTIRKIFNFISKLNEIRKVFTQLKTTITSAITFMNDLFKQAVYLKTFYDSLTNLLNVEGGEEGFRKLLFHYSENLFKFSQAKSESLTLIGDAQRESDNLIRELENEEGVEFLFGDDATSANKREELQEIIDNYLSHFETPRQVVAMLRENGSFLFSDGFFTTQKSLPNISYPEGISETCYFPDCENVHLEEDKWKHCPEGKFVNAIGKNNYGEANYIRCCNMPHIRLFDDEDNYIEVELESASKDEKTSEGLKTRWNYCPSGKFVTGIYKSDPADGDGLATKMSCSNIPSQEINYGSPGEVHLEDYKWRYCTDRSPGNGPAPPFVTGIHKNDKGKGGHANFIYCKEPERKTRIEVALSNLQDSKLTEGCTASIYYFESTEGFARVVCKQNLFSCIAGKEGEEEKGSCTLYTDEKQYYFPAIFGFYVFFDKPFPQQFGEHTISLPEIPTGDGKPREITISCPGNLTLDCYNPSNNWFENFKNTYEKIQSLYFSINNIVGEKPGDLLDYYLGLLNEIENFKTNLSSSVKNLPTIKVTDEVTDTQYWTTSTSIIYVDESVETTEEFEERAKAQCQYDPGLFYINWDNKIKTVLETNLNPIIEGLERYYEYEPGSIYVVNFDDYTGWITNGLYSIVNFLINPLINSELDTKKEKLTEIEETIEEAKPQCIEIHLEEGGWGEWDSGGLEICPEGKYVNAIHKNDRDDDGQANYIRCCDLPENPPRSAPQCTEVSLAKNEWRECPEGKFVNGVRKNWDSHANKMQCCNLPVPPPQESPSSVDVHLSDGGFEYCPEGKFVNGVRKNWDANANEIKCSNLTEERIPTEAEQKFDELLTKIGELKNQIEALKNYFLRLNQLWSGEATLTVKDYVENIIETKEISQDIASTIGESEIIFNQILALEDELLGIPGLPSKSRETIQEIFAPDGPLKGEINQFLFEGPDSIKNFVGIYQCPGEAPHQTVQGEGFLSELKCFEESNGKTFEQIWHFLNAIEKMEEVILRFASTTQQVYQIKPTLEIPAPQITTKADDLFKGEGLSFGGDVDSFGEFKDKLLQSPLSYLDDIFKDIDNYLNGIKEFLAGFIATSIEQRLSAKFDSNKAFLTGFLNDESLLEEFGPEINEIKDEKCPFIKRMIFGDENLKPGCKALNSILGLNPEVIECDCKDKSEYCQDSEEQGKLDFHLLYSAHVAEEQTKKCNLRYEIISRCGKKPVQYTSEGATTQEYLEWSNCISWINPSDFGIITLYPEALKIEVSEESFKQQCIELDYQKALKEECDSYEILKTALVGRCDVWEYTPYRNYCQKLKEDISKLNSYFPGWGGTVPDLTKEENKEELTKVRNTCATELDDIRTPLEEVMMVYSVLLGIKSGTLFFRGIKTSTEDAKRVYEDAQKFIAMIKELPKKLEETTAVKEVKSGFDIEAIRCIETPAVGYGGQTGPRGGPVCPRIDHLFSIIESNFAIMRQSLNHINLLRKEEKHWTIEIGQLRMSLLKTYPLYNGGEGPYYEKVNKLYQDAKEIKEKTQNVWALATAINFANQNCTCGQSYCQFPLCISGVPLTLSPLKDPYCYLIYILRYPFRHQFEILENYLK